MMSSMRGKVPMMSSMRGKVPMVSCVSRRDLAEAAGKIKLKL